MIYFALHTKQSNSYQIMRPGFVSVYYTGISTKSLVHKFRMQFSKVVYTMLSFVSYINSFWCISLFNYFKYSAIALRIQRDCFVLFCLFVFTSNKQKTTNISVLRPFRPFSHT